MAIVEVVVVPLGTATPSLSKYVANVEKVLDSFKDLKHTLTPMSTVIEGDLDTILKAVRKMHEIPFGMGIQRVATRIHIDDRRDKELTMDGKIQSVKEKL